MILNQLIQPESVLCNVQARSKKHCLEILSELLAQSAPGIANEEIFARLVERERLGCTCLDQGIAFPHCRVNGVESERGALMKLSEPVEFDAADGELVDVVFGLMVPEVLDRSVHATIEQVTGFLSDAHLRTRLREANSSKDLYDALQAHRPDDAAASRRAEHG